MPADDPPPPTPDVPRHVAGLSDIQRCADSKKDNLMDRSSIRREMSEQSAWDDLSWPASTMTFATFYQDVKLTKKALEEATRTRTGDNTFKIDTANVFETLKRAITRGTKGYKGL